MLYTTLTYNGTEKSLADWGVSSWSRQQQNQAGDNFTFTLPTPMDGAELFPYGDNVIIKINRVASRLNPVNPTLPASNSDGGVALTFSGGIQWFWGYVSDNDRMGDPGSESFTYKLAGPYEWFFGRTVFQQLVLTWNQNPASGSPRQFADWQSDIVLGLSINTLTGSGDTVGGTTATNLMSLAQQIKQICMYAQAASKSAYGSNQFQCDQLTTTVDGINYDLLQTPSANCLIKDYYGTPLSGQTSTVISGLLTVPGAAPAHSGTYFLRPPLDAANAVTCKEAMQRMLQWLGGVGSPKVWTDHSQTPPQLHIATPDLITTADPGDTTTAQRLAGGYILNLPLSGITVKNRIKKRSDLVPVAYHFKYKVNGSFLGAQENVVINDVAAYLTSSGAVGAPGASGVSLYEGIGSIGSLYDVNNPTSLLSGPIQNGLMAAALLPSAVIQTIEIQGSQVNGQQATVTTAAINPVDPAGTGADSGWWQTFLPHFATVSSLKFYNSTAPTFTDPASGATLYASYAALTAAGLTYSLPTGSLASWMTDGSTPIVTKKVRITGFFSFTENAPGTSTVPIGTVGSKEEHFDVTLTNAVSGTYQNITGGSSGDPIPFGLAGYLIELESVPQYEGSILMQETEISDIAPLGNRLNVTGGLTEWASMGAQIQSVRYSDNGQTEISFGPAKHLNAAQFVKRLQTNAGPRSFLQIGTNPMNSNSSNSNSVPPNTAVQAPSPGGKIFNFQSWLTNIAAQAGANATLPAGVHLDTGLAANRFTGTIASGQLPFRIGQGITLAEGPYAYTPGEGTAWIRVHMGDLQNASGSLQNLHPYLREMADCKTISGTPTPGYRLVLCSEFYTTSIRATPDP